VSALGAIGEGLGELTPGDTFNDAALSAGGDAANVCVMAARLGTPARLGGRVGDDALGRILLSFWRESAVDVAHVRIDPGAPTGLYVNETRPGEGHRFTYWRRDSAGSRLRPGDIDSGFFDALGTLVVTGVTLAVSSSSAAAARQTIAQARTRGVRVACVLNHRPALGSDPDVLARVAAASDVLIGSTEDAAAVFRVPPRAVKDALNPFDSEQEIALTDAERDATVIWREGRVSQAVPEVRVQNAAGAGDAFAGAYLASRLQGRSVDGALAYAVAAATLSVQRHGCAASYPSRAEVDQAVSDLPPPRHLAATAGAAS
jgi:2-dehydro-3-deoxygluconokinase